MLWAVKLLKERIFGHALRTKLGCLWVHSSSYMMSVGALKTGRAKPLNSHSTWCNGIKCRSASLSWPQSGALAQDHWSTDLHCAHGRPASLLPFGYPTCSRPLGKSLFDSIASPVVPLKNLGPFPHFASFSQVPKDSNSSGFFPSPKRCTSESMAPSLQTSYLELAVAKSL